MVVGSSGRPAAAPDHRARATLLPREQGRTMGVGDGVSATDGWERGEAGPDDSGQGAREKRERHRVSVGCRHAGPGGTVPGGAVQTGFETKSEFKWFKQFQTVSTFGLLEKYFPLLRKIEVKYDFEALEEGNNFLYRNLLRFRMDLE
jgi:hypothetical protein